MNYFDRVALVSLLVVTLLMVGLVIGNASVSGLAVGDIFSKSTTIDQDNKPITAYTLVLLVLSIIAILTTYFIFTKKD